MRKILYITILVFLGIIASCCKQPKGSGVKDSIVTVHTLEGEDLKLPLDSFLQLKDSFVFVHDTIYPVAETKYWCTKEYYKWFFVYPDTITVAFTRDGVFEDSIECERRGSLEDSCGKTYSPAYVFTAVIGDSWVYDINGKFIRFVCFPAPHSGRPHHYNP